MASSSRSIRSKVFSRATLIRLRRDHGGRVASGYLSVREQSKTILEKTTWAASFRRVGWDFRPALWAKPAYASHYWGVPCVLPFLLRKILSEVTPGPQQLNGEAHPRDGKRFRDLRVRRIRRRDRDARARGRFQRVVSGDQKRLRVRYQSAILKSPCGRKRTMEMHAFGVNNGEAQLQALEGSDHLWLSTRTGMYCYLWTTPILLRRKRTAKTKKPKGAKIGEG
jgi:hypothetical protein